MPDSDPNANHLLDHREALGQPAEATQNPVPLKKFELSFAHLVRLLLPVATLLAVLAATPWAWPGHRFEVGVAAGAVLGLLALWFLPKWQVSRLKFLEPRDLFEQENEARKTLAQIAGGILVLAGLYYTNENIKIAQTAADQTQKESIESRELSRQGQLTDRFSKAVEQLGKVDEGKNTSLPTRLGGIYALERIANESKPDHWPIIELLLQYLYSSNHENGDLTAEAQAILTALGRRKVEYESDNQKLYIKNLNLRGASLTGDFHNVAFDGSKLEGTRFFDINLQGSSFTMTDLTAARFQKADLKRAVFNSLTFVETPGIPRSTLTFTGFIDTDMTDLVGLNCEDVKATQFSDKAILPASLGNCNIVRTPFVEYYRGKK